VRQRGADPDQDVQGEDFAIDPGACPVAGAGEVRAVLDAVGSGDALALASAQVSPPKEGAAQGVGRNAKKIPGKRVSSKQACPDAQASEAAAGMGGVQAPSLPRQTADDSANELAAAVVGVQASPLQEWSSESVDAARDCSSTALIAEGEERRAVLSCLCCCIGRRRRPDGAAAAQEIVDAMFKKSELPPFYKWPTGHDLPTLRPLRAHGHALQVPLRVFCCSWNLAGVRLPGDVGALLSAVRPRHHIYALALSEWTRGALKEECLGVLGSDYELLLERSMREIRLVVIVSRSLLAHCRDVASAEVATGIGNTIGNKGAVLASFMLGGSSFLFISMHLAAGTGHEKMLRRNHDLARILLHAKLPRPQSQASPLRPERVNTGIHEAFDNAFLMGDLNYRVRASRAWVESSLATGSFEECLALDELLPQLQGIAIPPNAFQPEADNVGDTFSSMAKLERKSSRSELRQSTETIKAFGCPAFFRTCASETWMPPGLWPCFEEANIAFPPTYKYNKGTDVFDSSAKQRVPSWTDRVLWRRNSQIKPLAYAVAPGFRHSDHRPVFAQFEVTSELLSFE